MNKTKQQLVAELAELQQRVAGLEMEGLITDSTERKQAEKTLRLSEANYRAIFDTANDTIFVHDADSGAILDANQKATEMYGYTTEEFRHLNVEVLSEGHPPYSQAEAIQWIGRASTGSPQLFAWKARDKGGRIFWVEVNLKRTTLNGVPRLLAIVRDITDRKRAELALQESEERYRTIFEEGPLGIVLASLDLEVQYVNQRFCEMLGYSEMEIIALGVAGISHPDDLDTDHQLGLRLLRGELPYYTIDKRYIRKDRTAFWGQLTVSVMHDAEGKPTAMIRMIQDITARKEIAELLQESEAKYRRLHEHEGCLRQRRYGRLHSGVQRSLSTNARIRTRRTSDAPLHRHNPREMASFRDEGRSDAGSATGSFRHLRKGISEKRWHHLPRGTANVSHRRRPRKAECHVVDSSGHHRAKAGRKGIAGKRGTLSKADGNHT